MRLLVQLTVPLPPAPTAPTAPTLVRFHLDGETVEVEDDGISLLEALRDRLGKTSPKDGCSPQGQCGCCTVWVDGSARVACVTPVRRVAGRHVTTLDGLDPAVRDGWARAFTETGASQCGFCTPGIIMRLAALGRRSVEVDEDALRTALLAHLCRCTGWCSILEAARRVYDSGRGGSDGRGGAGPVERDLDAAARRAGLEGGTVQAVGPRVALGGGGFADDTAPADALVAVPDGGGGWVVAETLHEARREAGKVQGRNSTVAVGHPLEVAPGDFALTLQTTFVEPAYLEPDASWCQPGGAPASPLANGGAFGGKQASPVAAAARRLADENGRCVRVVMAREDVVTMGPKRPPIAAGLRLDGSGVLRVARTVGSPSLEEWVMAVTSVAPGLAVEEVEVPGPPVALGLRGAGWAEATVLLAGLDALRGGRVGPGHPVTVVSPEGAVATAAVGSDGAVTVTVAAGEVLDEVVLRSYAVGASHQALGWVRSEGVAVDPEGTVLDLTIRSFGILSARAMPPVVVVVEDGTGPPVRAADAVFAAVTAAAWVAAGLPPRWPTERGGT
ncbi:MAG TPA: 2Fe-2S iron-sulfur cluster-binding protein [Acidimicrobiales bacterium]|nr:2Fe-2S iron-sulfur cluster-binding protein [Acidimicrobiales bacterium]